VLLAIGAANSSTDPASALLGLIILFPLVWWMTWGIVGMFASLWGSLVEGGPPAVKVGRQWQSSSGARQQLREDTNADVFSDRGGILFRRRHWFVASGTPAFEIAEARYNDLSERQEEEPQYITSHRDRSYWWYQDLFYWTNVDYEPEDIRALLFARQRQRERELEHAHALLAASTSPAKRKRDPIPKEVKLAVFQRDEGRCVECGSDFDIQYDHIIPFTMGGASTVENLQLLCARCNQTKGGRL
jgi:hypothetical protein